MRRLKPIRINLAQLSAELGNLEAFLADNSALKKREQVLPFLRPRTQLLASLGWTSPETGRPDLYASELDLFGDFVCDAAVGDTVEGAYTLVEFEDAREASIFRRLEAGRSVKRWSPRFERGISQLVDWAWRIDTEGDSPALRRVFGAKPLSIHLLLVIGRRADLDADGLQRLKWRSHNTRLGPFSMSCRTFDDVLTVLRRRLVVLEAAPTGSDEARGP